MKISHLVTCHNEHLELERLLGVLVMHIAKNKTGDEIVILDDFSDNPQTVELLEKTQQFPFIKVVKHKLDRHFGNHKTFGSRACSGDFIFQHDADEYPSQFLLENLKEVLKENPTVELYRVPRVNIVRGATEQDAKMWGWNMDTLPEFGDLPIINWHNHGDYQSRIYKNNPKIEWKKPLHETIVGASIVSNFPKEVEWAIIHDKTIDRQRAQNMFYNQNWSKQANMGQG